LSNIVRWVLNWIAKNASASLYTSHAPVGHRLGGHDIPQVANCYVVLAVLIKAKPVWIGYFQAS
jgi:hypothetical protein